MGFLRRILGGGRPERSPEDVGREALVALCRRVLQERGATDIAPLTDAFGLAFTLGGRRLRSFLENIYQETREHSAEQREARVRSYVADFGVRTEALDWEAARPLLLPVLRAPMLGLGLSSTPDTAQVARAVLPLLRELVVVDLPTTMAYVTQAHASNWGVSHEELFAIAHANLAGGIQVEVSEYDAGLWHVEAGGDYESSFLLHPGFLSGLAGHVQGRLVAIVPERGQLYFGGDVDPALVVRLCDMAEREYAASQRSISLAPYTLNADGAVVPYVRPGDDAAAQRVAEAHVKLAGTEYSRQKAALEQEHQRSGEDVFVASFSGLEKGGRLVSFTTWALGVDSLLPETDYVAFPAIDARGPLFLAWADALRLAPEQLRPVPGMVPVRFRTGNAVPPEVRARLHAAAVPSAELG